MIWFVLCLYIYVLHTPIVLFIVQLFLQSTLAIFIWDDIFPRPFQQHSHYCFISQCMSFMYMYFDDYSDVMTRSECENDYSGRSRRLDDSQISSGYWSMDNSLTMSPSNTTVTTTLDKQGLLFNYLHTCILHILYMYITLCIWLGITCTNISVMYPTFRSMTQHHQKLSLSTLPCFSINFIP